MSVELSILHIHKLLPVIKVLILFSQYEKSCLFKWQPCGPEQPSFPQVSVIQYSLSLAHAFNFFFFLTEIFPHAVHQMDLFLDEQAAYGKSCLCGTHNLICLRSWNWIKSSAEASHSAFLVFQLVKMLKGGRLHSTPGFLMAGGSLQRALSEAIVNCIHFCSALI